MIDYHRRMLQDSVRNSAFAQALRSVIVPGETVVADIGSGTGFLGFLASRLGAKECLLYEYADVMRLSKELAQKNAIGHLSFINRHSREAKNPPRVDVVVSETLGNFGPAEHIIETMNDCVERHLKDGGILMPATLSQFVAPVTSDRFHREIDPWDLSEFKLDFSAARVTAFNNIYVRTIKPEDILDGAGSVEKFDIIDFSKKNESRRSADIRFTLSHDAEIFGFAIWWEALLIPSVTLSTSPFAPATHWEQIYLPLTSPLACRSGDEVLLEFSYDTRLKIGLNVTWRAKVRRQGKEVTATELFDMRKGHLN